MTDPKIVVSATGDFRRLNSDLKSTESRMGRLGTAAKRGLGIGFALAGAAVVGFGVKSVQSLARIERLNTQTAQAIKSTGGAAGVTAKHVEGLTGKLENLTATEAESIQGGANFLLTFTNLRNGIGKGNKIFDQAVVAMTDMSRALDDTGGATLDTRKTALQLGKALNDPIKGITALSRVGVSFTEGQKKTIASLVESGDTMKAQKVILHELTKEFGGSGEAFAKTAQGKLQLAGHAFGTFGETITSAILPALADLAVKGTGYLNELTEHGDDIKRGFGEIKDAVAPAVDEIVEALGHLKDSIAGNGDVFHDKFIPALEITSDIIGGLVNFVDELPGPVKTLGVQVGVAAIAFNYLNGKVTLAKDSLAKYTTGADAAAARSAKLQSALKSAAGIGGMLLLAKGTQEADHKLGLLEGAAGGALLGFSVGGPLGAAIGGGIGALATLATQTDDTAEAMRDSVPKIDSMRDALNQLTGALTDQARVQALENARKRLQDFVDLKVGEGNLGPLIDEFGKFAYVIDQIPDGSTIESLAGQFGLSARQITQASLGSRSAVEAVSRAFRKHGHDTWENTVAMRALRNIIGPVNREFRKNRAEVIRNAQATQDWSGKLKGFPKRAATKIDLLGVRPTEAGIARLVAKYKNIDKKDIKTILSVTGVEASVKDIQRAAAELKRTDRQEARTEVSVDGAVRTRGEIELTRTRLIDLDGNRADTYIYTHHVDLFETRGGRGPGAPSDGRMIVDGAPLFDIPILETEGEKAGTTIGKALAKGLDRVRPGKGIFAQILASVVGGSSGVGAAIDKLNKLIEQRTKDDKAGNARQKQILKGLADEFAALKRLGKAQDEINRKLEKAKEHLAEVRQFVDEVRQSFVDTGNVVNLGQLDDGTVSAPLLIDQLRDQVANAQRFADLIRELTAEGLNQTSLQQLLAAGPEAGLATAEALAQGGGAAIDEINNLTDQLAASGQTLGSQMSDQFFDVGLQASLGIVRGLESQGAALDRAARRLARRLAAEVRRALGIHSPSKEFQGIGNAIIDGLSIGLDDTYVKVQGQRVAKSLIDGFANPKLAAGADVPGGDGPLVVRVKLTAEEESQLRRGKSVTLDIDAGHSRGVRRRAVGGPR